MSYKLKILKEMESKIEIKIKNLESKIYANPLCDIIDIRKEAQEILVKHKNDNRKIAKLIEPLAIREKKII